jgi:hypothetical protein
MSLRDLVEPAGAISPQEKLQLALELHAAGVLLVRERLARERPDLDATELDAAVAAWLGDRPMMGVGTWGRLRDLDPLP